MYNNIYSLVIRLKDSTESETIKCTSQFGILAGFSRFYPALRQVERKFVDQNERQSVQTRYILVERVQTTESRVSGCQYFATIARPQSVFVNRSAPMSTITARGSRCREQFPLRRVR